MVAGKPADVAEVPGGPKDIPHGSVIETADPNIDKARVTQQPFQHQLAKVPDTYPVKTISFGIFRLRRHLGTQQRQQPPRVVPKIRHGGDEYAFRF